METPAILNLKEVSIRRQGETLLDKVSLQVKRGEIITLVGPNGAGKSTLVKTALGLMQPDQGSVSTAPGLQVGYVPQNVQLDASLPVSVKRFLQLSFSATGTALQGVLELVGASSILDKNLGDISGGEMRRVLLARALLPDPDLLILDEPTSGVDITGQEDLYTLIQQIRDKFQCGVLLVSHNLHVVMAATDHVVCLNRHLCCSGAPEDIQHHPEFISLFGQSSAVTLGFYRHKHDHDHDLHGNIREHSG
jgi:zinc transport system ATP-binding protein